ncbi:hypothetical protein O3P69_014863 [Scylla paramamosain]|uniref:protein-ribulosamine 3-kinase n=2 Tax=Scylla paramamosain TaxID=85552 RepID=A0AAW0U1C2_SCYPA
MYPWHLSMEGDTLVQEMVAAVREVLGSEVLQGTGELGGGLISEGEVFLTDVGKVFIKWNRKEKALDMYKGETAGLQQLGASGVVRVPEPLAAVELPGGGAALVLEYLPMKDLRHHSLNLARQLARLHLQNPLATTHPGGSRVGHGDARSTFVPHFGFHSPTPCGYILQDNTWCDDWQTFFSRKLQQQIAMIETEYGDREVLELWSRLQTQMPRFFAGVEVLPSLLHGDLWMGNSAETQQGPVLFDPGVFYGHHEYDSAVSALVPPGFGESFWAEYHAAVPKAPGWATRQKLYRLFHKFNQWNHFGRQYRTGCVKLMKELCG